MRLASATDLSGNAERVDSGSCWVFGGAEDRQSGFQNAEEIKQLLNSTRCFVEFPAPLKLRLYDAVEIRLFF